MPSKFRNASSKRISFFSFQDIITSVTGILILVTLMMTLYLNKAGGSKSVKVESRPQDDVKTRLQSLRQSNLWIMAQMNKVAAAPSEARLRDEKRELEASLKRLESRELNKVKALADQYDGLIKTNLQMKADSEQLQVKLEEFKKAITQKTSETNVVFVIKGVRESVKKPVIGVVASSSLTVERIGDPAGGRQLGGSDPVGQFSALMASFSPPKDYFVFLVRPSGIDTFYACRKLVREAGFDVGYEPIAEDLQFKINSEEGK